MATPTRFPSGIATVGKENPLGQFGMPDPTRWHVWFDDFNTFTITDWVATETEAGAGDAAYAVALVDGGVVTITNDSADNDLVNLQLASNPGTGSVVAEHWKMETGKKAFFKARFKLTDGNNAITDVDAFIGLAITDTSLLASAPSDGIYFMKTDGAATIAFHTRLNGTSTSTTAATMANDTYITVAWYYDGKVTTGATSGTVFAYVNDVQVAAHTTNICTDEELAISVSVMNGRASASVMSIDYIFMAKER